MFSVNVEGFSFLKPLCLLDRIVIVTFDADLGFGFLKRLTSVSNIAIR